MDQTTAESNSKKGRMLEMFMSTAYTGVQNSYRSYVFKRQKGQIQLSKTSKIIATWDINLDEFIVSEKLSPSEKQMARKFSELPNLAEQQHQAGAKNSTPRIDPKRIIIQEVVEKVLNNISDSELTKELLEEWISTLGDRYVAFLYDTGNPDHFADDLYGYTFMAKSYVKDIMLDLYDQRVLDLLLEPHHPAYWDRYDDQALLRMLKIVPLKAQREGNLVTITETNQVLFEHSCDEAYLFAQNYFSSQSLRNLVPKTEVGIYWWERNKEGKEFHVSGTTEGEIKQSQPCTFRESIQRKKPTIPKKKAKPSRLSLRIYFDENDAEGNVIPMIRKHIPQNGILYWS